MKPVFHFSLHVEATTFCTYNYLGSYNTGASRNTCRTSTSLWLSKFNLCWKVLTDIYTYVVIKQMHTDEVCGIIY